MCPLFLCLKVKDYDFREEIEVPENEYFMEVVEDLTDQANDYLEEWGE